MTTKPPSEIDYLSEEALLKKLYLAIDELIDILSVRNERIRLVYYLNLYFEGQISCIREAIDLMKPLHCKVDNDELENIVTKKLREKNIIK